MLGVYRRNLESRDAELRESEHTQTLKRLYSQALTYLNAKTTRLTTGHITTWIGSEFDMSQPKSIPAAPGERVYVRIGKEHIGWLERWMLPDRKPEIVIECNSHLRSLPTQDHTENYILSASGKLVFMHEDEDLEIPYVDLKNRVKLVREAVQLFTK